MQSTRSREKETTTPEHGTPDVMINDHAVRTGGLASPRPLILKLQRGVRAGI